MEVLFGIIFFHLLVIFCSRLSKNKGLPFVQTAIITMLMVLFVAFMMFTMDRPQF